MNPDKELNEVMPLLSPKYPDQYYQLFMKVKLKIQAQQYTSQLNDLIEKLITFGQSNYTCWVVKKKIVQAGQISIQQEDQYSEELLLDNLKNFQIWDYRNFIFNATKDYQRQFTLMDDILETSPKNYHLWSNRVKVVDYAKNYKQEIARTQKCIFWDAYNNSAWVYRFHCYNRAYNAEDKDHHEQIQWACYQTRKYCDNQSSWNYLRGFFPSHKINIGKSDPEIKQENMIQLIYKDYPEIQQLCSDIIKDEKQPENKKVLAILTLSIINTHSSDRIQFAKQNIDMLIQLEPLRKNYYNWLKTVI